jgi:hypothetical protein
LPDGKQLALLPAERRPWGSSSLLPESFILLISVYAGAGEKWQIFEDFPAAAGTWVVFLRFQRPLTEMQRSAG